MENGTKTRTQFDATKVAEDETNWDAYAEQYDVMCEINPSYQENIDKLLSFLRSWELPENPRICDLGAGTGNYITALAKVLPNAEFTHIDFDAKMNERALAKYREHGITRFEILTQYAQDAEISDDSFDIVLCINALYAISPQEEVLCKIHNWLRPDGRFFTIDFGRKQKNLDWVIYMFRESMKKHTVGKYVKALMDNKEIAKQNKQVSKAQQSGRYWLHTTEEFEGKLSECGFVVDEVFPCYRGYSDLAVCRKRT